MEENLKTEDFRTEVYENGDVVLTDMSTGEIIDGETSYPEVYDSNSSTNPAVIVAAVAAVGAVGYGTYKGIKKLKAVISDKCEERSKKRLEKRGYTVLSPREYPDDMDYVEEDNFESEPVEEDAVVEEKKTSKKK